MIIPDIGVLKNRRIINGDNIVVKYRIVPREETTCKRGEYCLLIYSEEKENFLLNIGYMVEQLDLYLANKDIGVCWYGMGKTQESDYGNLKFVIMLALGKGQLGDFILYFLELALLYNHISFQKFLCKEEDKAELIPIAIYNLL